MWLFQRMLYEACIWAKLPADASVQKWAIASELRSVGYLGLYDVKDRRISVRWLQRSLQRARLRIRRKTRNQSTGNNSYKLESECITDWNDERHLQWRESCHVCQRYEACTILHISFPFCTSDWSNQSPPVIKYYKKHIMFWYPVVVYSKHQVNKYYKFKPIIFL